MQPYTVQTTAYRLYPYITTTTIITVVNHNAALKTKLNMPPNIHAGLVIGLVLEHVTDRQTDGKAISIAECAHVTLAKIIMINLPKPELTLVTKLKK